MRYQITNLKKVNNQWSWTLQIDDAVWDCSTDWAGRGIYIDLDGAMIPLIKETFRPPLLADGGKVTDMLHSFFDRCGSGVYDDYHVKARRAGRDLPPADVHVGHLIYMSQPADVTA